MPKDYTNAGSNSQSYHPYPGPFSGRRESENVPDGRRSAPGVHIPQHRQPSSRPNEGGIPVGASSSGLTRGSSLYNAYPQSTRAHPPDLHSLVEPLPTPSSSCPPYWNGYPGSYNVGTIEGSTALLQLPPAAPLMVDLTPQLQRPADGSLQLWNGQAVEPWLCNAQHPLQSSMSLHTGSSYSPRSVAMVGEPSSSCSFFPGANKFKMRDVHFTINNPSDHDQLWFHGLPKHPDMSGRQPEYLPDSRTPDVQMSLQWMSSSTDLVLCIHGPAGIGKSTLAGHLSGQLRSVGRLGTAVFLGAFPPDTSGPETIIKTMAHELGNIHPRAIPKIVEAMKRCHGTSLEDHLEGYLLEPVRSLNHPHPLIIIVDALDEWQDHPRFLKALARLNLESAVIRFITTSRSNPRTFRLPNTDNISMHTHPLLPVSTDVMRSYFNKYLQCVPWVDGRKASSAEVNKLADLSGGLPVWAWTVILLLSQSFSKSPPHEILVGILASERQVGGSKGLSELYHNALLRLFPSPEARQYFRQYLGAALVLQEPLSLPEFSKLVDMPLHLVKAIHYALSTIQTRSPPDSDTTVHPASTRFHLSFLEFAQDSAVATREDALRVSAFDSHSVLGLTCLETINSLLPSLSPQASPRPHPVHGIQDYAIKHWPIHVSHGTHRTQDKWLQTPQCSALQKMAPHALQRWAAVFLSTLVPGAEEVVVEEQDVASILMMVADSLGEDDGDHWVFEVACLEVAVRLGSGCDKAWYKLGQRCDMMGYRTGNPKICEEAMFAFRRALELCPEPHANRSSALMRLGKALFSLYECTGDINTLNKATLQYRDALALQPAPHPGRPQSLNNLGIALRALYKRNGDINTLNEAIVHDRDALALRPAPHPDRSTSLNNLGGALQTLYGYNGDINTLNEAIVHYCDALALRPAPHPDRSMSLNNLGIALLTLYKCNRDISTLNKAILYHRDALALRPAPHPQRWISLHNVSAALLSQHDHNGDVTILNEAVGLCRELLVLHPTGHRRHANHREIFVECLEKRFALTGDRADHEEIEGLQRQFEAYKSKGDSNDS